MKRRKVHRQALRDETAELLRKAFENRVPSALAFPTMPDKFTLAEMFRADLAERGPRGSRAPATTSRNKSAGRNPISSRPKTTRSGGRSFYSLRHSHGTALGAAGVPQKDIQASLHHTRSATTDRYLKSDLEAKARAVNALPHFMTDDIALSATGTDDASPEGCLSSACPTGRSSVESSGTEKATPVGEMAFSERARRDSNPQPPDRQSGTLTN